MLIWIVTALSKANAIWATLAGHWRIAIGVILLVGVMVVGAWLDRKLFLPNPLKAENAVLTNEIKVVHDVKVIHDKISSMPATAVSKQLSDHWRVGQ